MKILKSATKSAGKYAVSRSFGKGEILKVAQNDLTTSSKAAVDALKPESVDADTIQLNLLGGVDSPFEAFDKMAFEASLSDEDIVALEKSGRMQKYSFLVAGLLALVGAIYMYQTGEGLRYSILTVVLALFSFFSGIIALLGRYQEHTYQKKKLEGLLPFVIDLIYLKVNSLKRRLKIIK